MAQNKPLPPKKPSSLPVPKPPAAELEIEEDVPRAAAPPAAGIATVIGVPALPDLVPPAPPVEKKGTLLGMAAPPAPPPPEPAPFPRQTEPHPSEPPLPPREGIATIAQKKWRELRDGPRPRLIAFAAVGGLVVVIFLGVLVRLVSAPSKDEGTASSASVSGSAAPPPVTSEAPVLPPPVAAPPKPVVCSVERQSRVVAPRAVVAAGVEVIALDGAIALGYASGPKEASIAILDPASATTTSVRKFPAQGTVKHVTPKTPVDKSAIDVDPKARRSIGAYDVGANGAELVWASHGSGETKTLWKLETDGAVEALRGQSTSDGIVVAYRHNGAIWAGAGKGANLEAASTPIRVAGLGPQLGAPAIALSSAPGTDGNVIVAWADRAEASQPWGLRMFSWHLGEAPKPAHAFNVPAGGFGEHAMSPSITPLTNGFLIVWTEGPMSKQQVRAQVVSADGTPSGDAMTVSADDVHAGQGQAAVLPDGRGVVAFLVDAGKAFELRAATMRCN